MGIIISSKLLNDFFRAVFEKRFSEAEGVIQEIEARGERGEFEFGFIQALKGIMLMYRSNDRYTFLNNIDLSNVDSLKRYQHEFSERSRRKLHGDYDRGYFSALAEYLNFMIEELESKPLRKPSEKS
jgi:hypothetical protein